MTPLFLDFETFWSDDYTLKKCTPIEYVLDPRFEALGCAFGDLEGNHDHWVDGPDLPRFFGTVDWANTWAISHNALFDMLVLSGQYQVLPCFYGDSMAMARNWLSYQTGRISLDACSKFYGMPAKMDTVHKTKGIGYAALRSMPALYEEVKTYALDDMGKCRTIFKNMLRDGFPPSQMEVVDWVVRMAAQPKFQLNQTLLAEHLAEVKAKKQQLLDTAGLENRDNLMSDPALAAMLLFEGVTPPLKVSKKTGKEGFAFAKTDKAFTELLEHENPSVQAIVAARLGHKSTLEETRTERLIAVARVAPQAPVPLKYSGAHTHRFSGDWSINLQNLRRGGKLRQAIEAPYGQKVVSIDAAQIEARLNATLAGQKDLIEQFRQGIDVYSKFAELIYHHEVNKRQHPIERFVGKTGILSLGYGSSPPVFQNMCRVQSDGQVKLTDSESTSIVYIYRNTMRQIVEQWKFADQVVLPKMAGQELSQIQPGGNDWNAWGPISIERNALGLPSGNKLRYRDLHHEMVGGKFQWMFMRGPMPVYTYGAKIVENVIQALAFIHIAEVAMRVKHMTNGLLIPSHQVHDELLYVVPDNVAERVKELVVREMSKPPVWMPNAPLAAEGHIGQTYGDTKG